MNDLSVTQDVDVTTSDITVVTDFDVEVIQTFDEGPPGPQGPQGYPGPPGPPGPIGPTGNKIWYDVRDPRSTDGVPGDSWINTATNMLFGPKGTSGWPPGTSLIGPQGAQGAQGPQGIQGTAGPQGNPGVDGNTVLYGAVDPGAGVGVNGNFYINTATHFMFGPKAGGAWPAGTSLIGPQGVVGPQGPQGLPGSGSPGTAVPIIDGVAAVGVSVNFAREDHVHPFPTAVRFDAAQALTDAQTLQARQNIYAAPFDALAYNGIQINGSMDVAQERGAVAVNVSQGLPAFISDMYQIGVTNAAGVLSVSQAPTNPATAPFGSALPNMLQLKCTTALSALASADNVAINHVFEGYRFQRLNFGRAAALPVTLAFWAFASIPGTATVMIRSGDGSRGYPVNFPINAANTWEYKVVTVPGCPDGPWPTGNVVGGKVIFCMAAGVAYQAPSGAWTTSGALGTPQTTNFFATAGNVFQITGLLVLPGSAAPSAAQHPMVMRPIAWELDLTMRHYETAVFRVGTISGTRATRATSWPVLYKEQKRAGPTLSIAGLSETRCSGTNLQSTDINGFYVMTTNTNTDGDDFSAVGTWIADARLT